MSVITLLTDFGLSDAFVGVMKGVIKTIAPTADVVDLTHDVDPFDIAQGSWLWKSAVGYFPPGSIHVGVVDPGVGTARLAIAARIGPHTFVCPDNGLLTDIARAEAPSRVHVLADERFRLDDVSRTFHGRDLFAPAAAHLSRGLNIAELGPVLPEIVMLPQRPPGAGTVRHIDRFGNAWTDIPAHLLTDSAECLLEDGRRARSVRSYGDASPGELVAIAASHGYVELAAAGASARERYGIVRGQTVEVRERR